MLMLYIYGILLIILGIATWVCTYKYVVPIGSIISILIGIFVIIWVYRQKLKTKKI